MARQVSEQEIGEKGFTLLEILIAICLLTVGLLAVASMQGSASRNNAFADSRTLATSWAANQMGKLLPLAWDNPLLSDADNDGAAGLNDVGGNADHEVQEGNFTIYWNVCDNQIINDTKTVNVIVVWSNYGLKGKVSMERVIARID